MEVGDDRREGARPDHGNSGSCAGDGGSVRSCSTRTSCTASPRWSARSGSWPCPCGAATSPWRHGSAVWTALARERRPCGGGPARRPSAPIDGGRSDGGGEAGRPGHSLPSVSRGHAAPITPLVRPKPEGPGGPGAAPPPPRGGPAAAPRLGEKDVGRRRPWPGPGPAKRGAGGCIGAGIGPRPPLRRWDHPAPVLEPRWPHRGLIPRGGSLRGRDPEGSRRRGASARPCPAARSWSGPQGWRQRRRVAPSGAR